MEKELAKNIPAGAGRTAFLSDNCDKVEERGYMKHFTPDQLLQMKDELSEIAIQINDIEIQKKELLTEIKARLEPLTDEKVRLLSGLKIKAEFVKEKCFKFVDSVTREVGYYNENGDLIEPPRPAYADELQGTIFQISRTGTDN